MSTQRTLPQYLIAGGFGFERDHFARRTDALNELASVTDLLNAANNVTYAYDANGNRTAFSAGGVTTHYSFNIIDQLVVVHGARCVWTSWRAVRR